MATKKARGKKRPVRKPAKKKTTKKKATKKAAARKSPKKKTAAKKKAVAKPTKRVVTPKIGGPKVISYDDLVGGSDTEDAYAAKGDGKARRNLRRLERDIDDRGGRGITIGGRPAPGTPEDTKERIDRGIVRPGDI